MKDRHNFHTHTTRCGHAYGQDEEYVLSAIENGYSILGFSDHTCWRYKSDFRHPTVRMDVSEFPEYKKSILSLKEKYKDQIEIRLGLEAEYFGEYMDWLLDFCIENELEYLVFGCHYYRSDELKIYYGRKNSHINDYFDDCIHGMETGMYAYLAHPDLLMRDTSLQWTKEIENGYRRICKKAKELDLPLEYNVVGLQANMATGKEMYPYSKFWQLAGEYHNKAIIGMDAHKPSDLNKELYDLAYNNLSKYDVEIVNTIPRIDYKKLKEKKG